MAQAFRREGEELVAGFSREEIAVVRQVLSQVRDLVAPEEHGTSGADPTDPFEELVAGLGGGPAAPEEPDDPALLRLLPPASRDDAEQAQEFRRLTEHGLRRRKADNLDAAVAALAAARPPELRLDEAGARALAVALTDARLVLGERLGLRSDEDSERLHAALEGALAGQETALAPEQIQLMAYYDFLSWVQESLTVAMTGR